MTVEVAEGELRIETAAVAAVGAVLSARALRGSIQQGDYRGVAGDSAATAAGVLGTVAMRSAYVVARGSAIGTTSVAAAPVVGAFAVSATVGVDNSLRVSDSPSKANGFKTDHRRGGVAGLAQLKGMLNKKQLEERAESFAKAERFIRSGPASGGIGFPGVSFEVKNTSIRVDVEVRRGINFVQ